MKISLIQKHDIKKDSKIQHILQEQIIEFNIVQYLQSRNGLQLTDEAEE